MIVPQFKHEYCSIISEYYFSKPPTLIRSWEAQSSIRCGIWAWNAFSSAQGYSGHSPQNSIPFSVAHFVILQRVLQYTPRLSERHPWHSICSAVTPKRSARLCNLAWSYIEAMYMVHEGQNRPQTAASFLSGVRTSGCGEVIWLPYLSSLDVGCCPVWRNLTLFRAHGDDSSAFCQPANRLMHKAAVIDQSSMPRPCIAPHNIELSTRPASDKNHKDLDRKWV